MKRLKEKPRFAQVLAGPRQVGKATVVRQVMKAARIPAHYASADEPTLRDRNWLEQQWDIARPKALEGKTGASPDNFVYLGNQGTLRFAAHTLPEAADGRWMTLDAGDLDGDGDIDIALGSFARGPTTQPIPAAIEARWRKNGAAVLLLENLRK